MTALASLGSARQAAPTATLASLWSAVGGDPAALARVLVYSAFRDMDPGSEAADPELLQEALRLSESTDAATRREILGPRCPAP